MPNSDTIQKFFSLLDTSRNILLLNSKPDGDSIGSSLGLNLILKNLNKQVTSLSSSQIPDYLRFLTKRGEIRVNLEIEKENLEEYDLVICLDTNNISRCIDGKEVKFSPKAKFIFFDHHEPATVLEDADLAAAMNNPGHKNLHEDQGNTLTISDPSSESTCGLIVDVFKEYRVINNKDLFDIEVAFLLYSGIVSDTDYFGYSNVTKQTFERAAFLLNYEFDHTPILLQFRETLSLKAFKFIQRNIDKVVVNEEKRYSYLKLKRENFTPDDNVLVVNEAANYLNRAIMKIIDVVDFCFILRESGDNRTSLTMRRHNNGNDIDLSKIAAQFGGGGHKQAAGAQIMRNIDEIEKEMLAYLDQILVSTDR